LKTMQKICIYLVCIALLGMNFTHVQASRKTTYQDYSSQIKDYDFNNEEIVLKGTDFTKARNGYKSTVDNKEAVFTSEDDYVEWKVNIKSKGFYYMEVLYYPLEGTGSAIERNIYIDGEIPFDKAYAVELSRFYRDNGPITQSKSGMDIRPDQVEVKKWSTARITDKLTSQGEVVYFNLSEGEHTIALESLKEPMAIAEIRLISRNFEDTIKSYNEVVAGQEQLGATSIRGVLTDGIAMYQGEAADEKSDLTLYAGSDITSPATIPYDNVIRKLNVIGGEQWNTPGQWISWTVEVPESGFYHIGLRSRQNYNRDLYSNRTLYIDDEIPFKEVQNVKFLYSDSWKVGLLGGKDPYNFYLEKGTHEIKLKVTLGNMSGLLTQADEVLKNLNKANLELLALMGSSPDTERDYQFEELIPDTLKSLKEQSEIIDVLVSELIAESGQNDEKTAELNQLASLLKKMTKNPDKISSLYSQFQTSIGSFGSWIASCREMPLQIDYIFLAEEGAKLPRAESGFFENLFAGVQRFIASFFVDYTKLSDEVASDAITVWIGNGLTGGRDQAIALNKLISDEFTSKTGIPVNLQLVPANTVLSATLAGKGPDVVLQVGAGDPVNYAMRNAVYDLSSFEDFDKISERFFKSSFTSYEYQGGTYALPETFSFPMLFYREDILEDLGIDINSIKTWDDILEILPVIQQKNMKFGLSANASTFDMFLYQMGGQLYTDDLKETELDSDISVAAFKFWMEFYNNYGLPKEFDFKNRFRTGEMPIGIADYTMYNLLSVAAPEIAGLWQMKELPGIEQKDGTISNIAPSGGSGAIIMQASKYKNQSWEFLKWWTSENTQYSFGKELEAVMGVGARYNTANIDALQKLPWSASDRKELLAQAENTQGTPEVPGGYYTNRNLEFAMWTVLNDKSDPREVLLSYTDEINGELKAKRIEFGLK